MRCGSAYKRRLKGKYAERGDYLLEFFAGALVPANFYVCPAKLDHTCSMQRIMPLRRRMGRAASRGKVFDCPIVLGHTNRIARRRLWRR